MKTLRFALVLSVTFCFLSSLSYAQDINRKGPCRADVAKFCKEVKPGHGRLAQCMKQHEAELSPACSDYIYEGKEKARDFAKACRPDAEKLCKDVKPGHGRVYRCLKANEAQLSPDCGAHFKK